MFRKLVPDGSVVQLAATLPRHRRRNPSQEISSLPWWATIPTAGLLARDLSPGSNLPGIKPVAKINPSKPLTVAGAATDLTLYEPHRVPFSPPYRGTVMT